MIITLLIRIVVFGIALTYATRTVPDVKVDPRSALPVVALVFALLNTLLYGLVSFAVTVLSLGLFWLVAPFVANAVLLFATDKLLKPFEIKGLSSLLMASGIMTVAHGLLRFLHL